MSNKIRIAKDNVLKFFLSEKRSDGSWGPNGSVLYRITSTSLALACLKDAEGIDLSDSFSFITKILENPKLPKMTRYFAWPLLAIKDSRVCSIIKTHLIRLQNTNGGWGYSSIEYAKKVGREEMASSGIMPTFLSVLGLYEIFKKDDIEVNRSIEKAVNWILAIHPQKNGSIVSNDALTSPICSTSFALSIFEMSESHSAPDELKKGALNFILRGIEEGKAFEIEIIKNAGRELNTPYSLFTPAWVLFYLSISPKSTYVRQICYLINYLLKLQKSAGNVYKAIDVPSKDIFMAAQFYLSISKIEKYFTSPNFIDDIISSIQFEQKETKTISRRRTNPVVLHISDIHWGANPSEWLDSSGYDTTFQSLKRDINEKYPEIGIPRPNILLISGDITHKGKLEGYSLAKKFITSLADLLEIDDRENRIIIVPGNHDLNQSISKLAYDIYRPNSFLQSRLLEMCNYRFIPFKLFFEDLFKTKRFNLNVNKMYNIYDSLSSHNTIIIGLNSASGTDHTEARKNSGLIFLETIEDALSEVKKIKMPKESIKIVVWHHALLTLAPNDPSFESIIVQRLIKSGFNILLHGHIHRPLAEYYTARDLGAAVFKKFGVGSVSVRAVDRPPEWPRNYQIFNFNSNNNTAEVFARQLMGIEWTAAPIFQAESSSIRFRL